MEAWYALYTKPNAEVLVARTLMVRGFEIYLPLLPSRQDVRAKPFFPTYLFVRCDLESVDVRNLYWVPGLRRIVRYGNQPVVVPDKAIEMIEAGLRKIEAQGGLPKHHFKPGDEVIIEEGPLRGLSGIFQGPMTPAERVRILVDFLGRANRTEVPVSALRAATEEESRCRRRGTRGHGRRIHYRDAAPPKQ